MIYNFPISSGQLILLQRHGPVSELSTFHNCLC